MQTCFYSEGGGGITSTLVKNVVNFKENVFNFKP